MSDENGSEPGVSTNERGELVLDLAALSPKSRWLRLPTPVGEVEAVRIPGGLPLDVMVELRSIERELQNPDSTDDVALDALQRFAEMLRRMIEGENPDLPADFRLELGLVQATRLLVFLAQPNDSIASAFVEAITAGGGEKPDVVSDDAHAVARAAGLEGADGEDGDAPLRSTKRSSSASSPSGSSTTGRRSGGSGRAARSRRSASTSRTRSAASASESATD